MSSVVTTGAATGFGSALGLERHRPVSRPVSRQGSGIAPQLNPRQPPSEPAEIHRFGYPGPVVVNGSSVTSEESTPSLTAAAHTSPDSQPAMSTGAGSRPASRLTLAVGTTTNTAPVGSSHLRRGQAPIHLLHQPVAMTSTVSSTAASSIVLARRGSGIPLPPAAAIPSATATATATVTAATATTLSGQTSGLTSLQMRYRSASLLSTTESTNGSASRIPPPSTVASTSARSSVDVGKPHSTQSAAATRPPSSSSNSTTARVMSRQQRRLSSRRSGIFGQSTSSSAMNSALIAAPLPASAGTSTSTSTSTSVLNGQPQLGQRRSHGTLPPPSASANGASQTAVNSTGAASSLQQKYRVLMQRFSSLQKENNRLLTRNDKLQSELLVMEKTGEAIVSEIQALKELTNTLQAENDALQNMVEQNVFNKGGNRQPTRLDDGLGNAGNETDDEDDGGQMMVTPEDSIRELDDDVLCELHLRLAAQVSRGVAVSEERARIRSERNDRNRQRNVQTQQRQVQTIDDDEEEEEYDEVIDDTITTPQIAATAAAPPPAARTLSRRSHRAPFSPNTVPVSASASTNTTTEDRRLSHGSSTAEWSRRQSSIFRSRSRVRSHGAGYHGSSAGRRKMVSVGVQTKAFESFDPQALHNLEVDNDYYREANAQLRTKLMNVSSRYNELVALVKAEQDRITQANTPIESVTPSQQPQQ
ncbi:hypothetical protein GQ42DRAFT_24846 [Ramicandelaber brevisporus]|nr:hypothetical protein GQ42DRAFT_24846 [Ramicandelaber brevisporus]